MTLAALYEQHCRTYSDIQDHLPRFVELVEELDATHVIELGTRTGVSTIAWLHALDGRGTLDSVDLDPKPDIGDWPHWTFHQGDDLEVVKHLEPADVVFIDTSHTYEHTRLELEAYLPLARSYIVCHDTQLRIPEGAPSRPLFPVRKAIVEFVERHGFDWFEHTDSWGLGIIDVRSGDGD